MNNKRAVGLVVGLLFVTALLGIDSVGRLSAQDNGSPTAAPTTPPTATPPPTPTAYPLQKMGFNLLAAADAQLISNGTTLVRAATISVAPGTSSIPFTNEGPVVISVTTGRVVVVSDHAVISVTDVAVVAGLDPVAATPGPLDETTVTAGQQIFLPAGSTTTIMNESAAAAGLLIVAVVPFPDVTPVS
jgi:hypothetical protein